MVIVLVVAAIFGADLRLVIPVLALVGWPVTARLTRVQFLSLAECELGPHSPGVARNSWISADGEGVGHGGPVGDSW